MLTNYWLTAMNSIGTILPLYVLIISFVALPNEMFKWYTVSSMIACILANIFHIVWIVVKVTIPDLSSASKFVNS